MSRLEALARYVASLHSSKETEETPEEEPLDVSPKMPQTILSARSSGFRFGNFSEIWFGSKLYLPRTMSRRGLTLLSLNSDLKTFRLWQFDFYPFVTAKQVNEGLIRLLQKLPPKSYFSLTVKDDIYRNLELSTRHFLANVVGSKAILGLQFRDSWAIVVYKPTLDTFQVLGEDHKNIGVARVDVKVPIHHSEEASLLASLPSAPVHLPEEKEQQHPHEKEEELKEGLQEVKKDLNDYLYLLNDLKKESQLLKKQLTAQLSIIRSIKDLVIQNEEAVSALSGELHK